MEDDESEQYPKVNAKFGTCGGRERFYAGSCSFARSWPMRSTMRQVTTGSPPEILHALMHSES